MSYRLLLAPSRWRGLGQHCRTVVVDLDSPLLGNSAKHRVSVQDIALDSEYGGFLVRGRGLVAPQRTFGRPRSPLARLSASRSSPGQGNGSPVDLDGKPCANVTVIRFQGTEFPTVLHAQWALLFDDLLISWRFRVESFALRDGWTYEPDFWLPTHQLWFQVGGDSLNGDDYRLWQRFAAAADATTCDERDRPPFEIDDEWHCKPAGQSLPDEWQARDVLYSVGGIPAPEQMTPSGPMDREHDSMYTANETCYEWTACPSCGYVGAEFCGRADRLACGHGDPDRDKNYRADDPRILAAYRLARQAIAARMPGRCARCEGPIDPGDLVAAGRAIGNRRWYHADCLLFSRRERRRSAASDSHSGSRPAA